MASFEVWGHWWLPERAHVRLPGRLVVDPVHGAHLTLIGALREVTDVVQWVHDENGSSAAIGEDDLEAAGTYARILGDAEGQLFTLDDGVQLSVRGPMLGASFRQRVHVRYVYQGTHFLADEPATATTVILQPAGLNTWVAHSAITGSINPESRALSLQGAPLPVQSAALDSGATVELRHHLGTPRYTDEGVHIPESFAIAVTCPDPVPVRELIAIASDIQDLISIATGRPAAFDSLSLRHPDVSRAAPAVPGIPEAVAESRYPLPIELFARWTVTSAPQERPLGVGDLYFTLEQLGGLDGVARWLNTVRRHRSTLGRVMSTRRANRGPLHDHYLDRLAPVEGMDTLEHGRGTTFRERILRSAREAGATMAALLGGRHDRWAAKLTKDRNDMAHHKGIRLNDELSEQYFLSESAYWLYVLRLLRMAQAPEAVFDQIAEHRKSAYLKRQLSKILQ
ncbi:hypothetical protein AB0368_33580 [Actinoplanes sp. NPDC051475]|uniref:ApeA N-terminal domain 1-containing protein n=1 Tax=Actinoplanes sp. NPDC051475 TaxID=3157225 RepID=UPI00344D5FB0